MSGACLQQGPPFLISAAQGAPPGHDILAARDEARLLRGEEAREAALPPPQQHREAPGLQREHREAHTQQRRTLPQPPKAAL